MSSGELFQKKFTRLSKWMEKSSRIAASHLTEIEGLLQEEIKELENARDAAVASFNADIEQLGAHRDQAAKEYTHHKYQLERDTTIARSEIEKLQGGFQAFQKQADRDLAHLQEEKVNTQVSFEKQKSALCDLYEEQRRHLLVEREKVLQAWAKIEESVRNAKVRTLRELETLKNDNEQKLGLIRDQMEAKQQGWQMALETMRRDYESLAKEKDDLEKKLSTIRSDKEKELESAHIAMQLGKEQLEIDKATLIEKAEEDKRRCEGEVREYKEKVEAAEKELQDLILGHDQRKKDAEESFEKEESILKEAVKNETEKRDYEQKLYQQEKADKEKEINRLREEYEKKKWHWENQIRTLMMQKSVQEAEFDAEKMRVDRQARVAYRSLEAKRDELKQRLSDIKSRHQSLVTNAEKENDLLAQRWQWRKDRLWSMLKNRLDVIRKEREALSEQLENLSQHFSTQQTHTVEAEGRENKRIDDLQQFIIQITDKNQGQMKQKEIQLELEKTRILAQIKECESLIDDWMDRLQMMQAELSKRTSGFGEQISFLDRHYQEEEKQTELFLQSFQKALVALGERLPDIGREKNAA